MTTLSAPVSAAHAIILGLVQGLTEFLPVSSSGHLILAPYFLNFEDPGLAFDVALHMGTLAAILVFFWKDWFQIATQCQVASKELVRGNLAGASDAIAGHARGVPLALLILGTLPAAVIGLMLEKLAEETFRAPALVACTLAGFGALLWYWDVRGTKSRDVSKLNVKDALYVGLAQAVAIVPGVSRSGVTITTGLALGLTRQAAARFSFLLSGPITAGAGLLKMKYIFSTVKAGGAAAAAVGWGFAASLVSGLAALGLLNLIVKSNSYKAFAIYRFALAFIIIVLVIIH